MRLEIATAACLPKESNQSSGSQSFACRGAAVGLSIQGGLMQVIRALMRLDMRLSANRWIL